MRSLGRAGVEVHAFTESPRVPLARSAYLHRPHPMPGASAGTRAAADEAAVAALDRAGARIGRRAVLIAMDDRAALLAARLPERVRSRFLLADVGPALPERLADKSELVSLCSEFGIAHPRTEQPESLAEVRRAVARLGLPLIAKWSRPWRLPPDAGLRSTTPVRSEAEALNLYERSAEAGSSLLLQRLLPGRPGADWFFHGCFGADGRLLAGGTGRKELSWPVGAGLTAAGSWLPHAQLTRDAMRLAQRLGYRGILDLDFRWDPDTGAYHLLDANPRPGAQFRLFTDLSGIDVVRALHLDLTGRSVPDTRPVPGRMFVAENYAPVSALLTARNRRVGPAPRPPIPGRRSIEPAWFAPDDLAPFLAMAAHTARRAAQRLTLPSAGAVRRPAAPSHRGAGRRVPSVGTPAVRATATGRRAAGRTPAGGGAPVADASPEPSPTAARAEPAPPSAPRSNTPETTGTSRKVSGDY
ncbi:ATP-grasp domain-containing protein [Streptomyces spiramenti]|uniref:ATP-grasp domain-containing protein n=1 Tax=Streptomyces spiramenti TaxID=2720606 RepID=A0ABX1AH47_9ACTN|nr:ATP-grasp domain-containing protein [Streptomyces spiramenti]